MPAATHNEDDDPVIASYDVFITPNLTAEQDKSTSNLYILQYPAHRPSSKPYNSARGQKPVSLRVKPKTGVLEVDVPLVTSENYNEHKGAQFGHALAETKSTHLASGYGLSGGFSNNPNHIPNVNVQEIPQHGETEQFLTLQTLGGKTTASSDRDPVYMLASVRGNAIHLTHVDALVQMRPQLHHLDARDELAGKKAQGLKGKQGLEGPPVKLETKAIEMKIKDTKEDAKDRNLNANAKLLREIQAVPWKTHDWKDQHDRNSLEAFQRHTRVSLQDDVNSKIDVSRYPALKSSIDNDEWLDRMSSPGIELRTRLKGRDRERARRKRQERLRLSKTEATTANTTATGPFVEGSATESSSEEDGDVDAVDTTDGKDKDQIKSEPDVAIIEPPTIPKPTDNSDATPRRRGRPKKNHATEVVDVDD